MIFKAFVLFALFNLSAAAFLDSSLLISAFNVKDFGLRKMGLDRSPRPNQEKVVARLVQIVQRYDLIIIQEIRDRSGRAFRSLVQQVNRASNHYTYVSFVSPRYGRYRKEQYGYIYRKERVKPVGWVPRLPDRLGNIFERDPCIVQFECLTGCQQHRFNTIVDHVKPYDAVKEISNLVHVYDYAVEVSNLRDAVILGDLNAACNYVKEKDWPNIALRNDKRFTWLIGDNADTSVSNRRCAYDRIITTGEMTRDPNLAGVYNFAVALRLNYAQATAISDHYPVELRVL